jgi:DNA-binding MarR family transcriptional regulator
MSVGSDAGQCAFDGMPALAPRSRNLHAILLCLGWALRAMESGVQRALASDDLGIVDWLIIVELAGGTSSVADLARNLKRDPASLSRAINRLVRRQFVTSIRIERDRRRTCLALTPEGQALHRRLASGIERLIDEVPDPANAWGLARLQAHLEKVCGDVSDEDLTTARGQA